LPSDETAMNINRFMHVPYMISVNRMNHRGWKEGNWRSRRILRIYCRLLLNVKLSLTMLWVLYMD